MIPYKIGIVGHRFIDSPETQDFVVRNCLLILSAAKRRHKNLVALSAIALGADTLFAQAALSLSIPLRIVRPFEEYAADFSTEKTRQMYAALCAAASHEKRLPFKKRSEAAYFTAMQWVVSGSDMLIAVWDGSPGKGRGGTADAVRQARSEDRDWIHLNVTDLSQHFYCKKESYV